MEKTAAAPLRMTVRLAVVALACAGFAVTALSSSGGFMATSSLCYYTVQSNLWALAVALAGVVLAVCRVPEPEWFKTLRFVVAVAVMVTLLVFWAMLAPTTAPGYLLSVSNLTLHTLVPLLMLTDALFIDRAYVPTKKQTLFCALPPLYYFIFALLRAELSGKTFPGGSRFPYWFIDLDRYGWFGLKNGVGVFYWVLVVIALVLVLGGIMRAVKKRI